MNKWMRAGMTVLLAQVIIGSAMAAPLPDPKTGGGNGRPISLLLLKGHMAIGFGEQPPLDQEYLKRLRDSGYAVAEASDFQPLTMDHLKQFNAVIYIYPTPYAGGAYFWPAGWIGGVHMLTVRKNVELLREYVEAGGGLLLNPGLEEWGLATTDSLVELMAPYGLEPRCAVVHDTTNAFVAHKVINTIPLHYAWTEAIAQHPATEGVKRIYYPTHVMRWDDNYTTIPLYPKDKTWTVLARGMPESFAAWSVTSIYSPSIRYYPIEDGNAPPIAVARDYGKGRVAAVGVSHFHLFYYTYSTNAVQFWEDYFGPTDGMIMEKGDGKVPSNLGKLLDNLYRWLAEPGAAAGLGGYTQDRETGIPPTPEPAVENVSAVWADKDPMVTGEIRPMKILVGARTALSGGKGTPSDYAEAAKRSGYDVVCFTETFENINPAEWAGYVEECAKRSDDSVILVPGLNISDALDNRFLLIGKRSWPRYPLLDESRKKLIHTGHMVLGMGDILAVAARPGQQTAVREHGCLPAGLYSHTIGFAVATYRDGKQVDDGLPVFQWQLFNASHPVPVAVHEVDGPDGVTAAVKSGLQNYVNSDTPANAAFYYHQGIANFGGNPKRYYVSSGPTIANCVMDDWQSPHWKISLEARDDAAPVTEALVRDQNRLYRRFLPNTNSVSLSWQGDLGAQHWFLVELKDARGGRAFLGGIRTLPERAFVRCADRQNWFGALPLSLLNYTGRMGSMPSTGIRIDPAFPGLNLPNLLSPLLELSYNGPGWTIIDYRLDYILPEGVQYPSTDAYPIFNVVPLKEFEGNIRYRMLPVIPADGRVTPSAIRHEVTLRLNEPLVAQGRVWPVVAHVAKATNYLFTAVDGKAVEGQLAATNDFVDLPAGGVIGDILALTPIRVDGRGQIGFPSPGDGQTVPAGTAWRAAFLRINPAQIAEIRNSMGFDGGPTYQLKLRQGQLDGIAMDIYLTASGYGAAGTIKGAAMPAWTGGGCVPVSMSGANPAWPVGLWRSDDGAIQSFGVFEGQALGRMNVTSDFDFYFGNLLIAGDANLNLAFASEWTGEGVVIEANNPTDTMIETEITSPAAIKGRKAVKRKVVVPAGTTILVEVRE